jgi:PAS domain S-box-containing protein
VSSPLENIVWFLSGAAALQGLLFALRQFRPGPASDPVSPVKEAASFDAAGLLDSLEAIVWERDAATLSFTYLNQRCEHVLGSAPSAWTGHSQLWEKSLHPGDKGIPERLRELIATGEPYSLEYRLFTTDARTVWFEETGTPIRDEQGHIIRLRGMLRDVTARKDAEEAERQTAAGLARERVWLDSLLNSIPAVVFENWWSRETGVITSEEAYRGSHYVNAHVEKFHGFTTAEWTSTPEFWFSRVHPEDREKASKSVPAQVNGGKAPEGAVYRWVRKDGQVVWGETHLVPLRGTNGKFQGIRGITLDVTERVEAERAAVEASRQLVDASRRAGMAEVATSVLHNVGNALNSVNVSLGLVTDKIGRMRIGSLQRLASTLNAQDGDLLAYMAGPQGAKLPSFLAQLGEHFLAEQKSLRAELDHLRSNIEHINDIVSTQQRYAVGGGLVEVLPVDSLIDDALRMNSSALERHGSRVITEFDTSIPPLPLDRNKVLLILMNLIRNAKYACEDGTAGDKCITLRTQRHGHDSIQISVSDNGIGIPEENIGRIFEHGFTTRKGGHGFGLHSSALAAREMGGLLCAQSDGLGHGATFRLQLPFAAHTTP